MRVHWTNVLIVAIAAILLFWSFIVPLIIRFIVRTIKYDFKIDKLVLDVGNTVYYNTEFRLDLDVPTSVNIIIQHLNINNALTIAVNEELSITNHNSLNVHGSAVLDPIKLKDLLRSGIESIDLIAATSIKKYITFYNFLWIERSDYVPEIDAMSILKQVHWQLHGMSVAATTNGLDVKIDVYVKHPLPISLNIQKASTRVYLGNLYLGRGGITDLVIAQEINHLNVFLELKDNWHNIQRFLSKESNSIGLLDNTTISGPIEMYRNGELIDWLYLATEDLQISFGLNQILKMFLTGFFDVKAFLKTIDILIESNSDNLYIKINFPFQTDHIKNFHLLFPIYFNVYYKDFKIVTVEADPDLSDKKVELQLNLYFFNFDKLKDVAHEILIENSISGDDLLKDLYIGDVQVVKQDCEWCNSMLHDFRLSLDFLSGLEDSSVFYDAIDIIRSLVVIKNIDSVQSQSYSGFDVVAHIQLSNAFRSITINLNNVLISLMYKQEFVQLKFNSLSILPGPNDVPCRVYFDHNSADFADLIHNLLYVNPPIIYLNHLSIRNTDLTVPIPINLNWFFSSKVSIHDFINFNISSIQLNMNRYNAFTAAIQISVLNLIPLHVITNNISAVLTINDASMFNVQLSGLDMPIDHSVVKFDAVVAFGNTSMELASLFVDSIINKYEPPCKLALTSLVLKSSDDVDLLQDINLPYELTSVIQGKSTISVVDLITPIHDLELELLYAQVQGIQGALLSVNLQILVNSPIPVIMDIPFVQFDLSINDVLIMNGTVHSFHMQPDIYVFNTSITIEFSDSTMAQSTLNEFINNAFNNVENLPVTINNISMAPGSVYYTHILNQLKVYFTRFISISSLAFVDYLKQTTIKLNSANIDYTRDLMVDLNLDIQLPFKYHIIMNYIQLKVLLDNIPSMLINLNNVDISTGKDNEISVRVRFISDVQGYSTFGISSLRIGYSEVDYINTLQLIVLNSPTSTFVPIISIPFINSMIPLFQLVYFNLNVSDYGKFDLSAHGTVDLNIPVSVKIPHISLHLVVNDVEIISVDISDFQLTNGVLKDITVKGSFIDAIKWNIYVLKSITGNVGIQNLEFGNNIYSTNQLRFVKVLLPLDLVVSLIQSYIDASSYSIPKILQSIYKSISSIDIRYIKGGISINPEIEIKSDSFRINIPFISASILINNELFVSTDIVNLFVDNTNISVHFSQIASKAIVDFVNNEPLIIACTGIKFGTMEHPSMALNNVAVILDITLDTVSNLVKSIDIDHNRVINALKYTISKSNLYGLTINQSGSSFSGALSIFNSLVIFDIEKLLFTLKNSLFDLDANVSVNNAIISVNYYIKFYNNNGWQLLFQFIIAMNDIQLGINNAIIINQLDVSIDLQHLRNAFYSAMSLLYKSVSIADFDLLEIVSIKAIDISNVISIDYTLHLPNSTFNISPISADILIDSVQILNSIVSINSATINTVIVDFDGSDQSALTFANLINDLINSRPSLSGDLIITEIVIGDVKSFKSLHVGIPINGLFTFVSGVVKANIESIYSFVHRCIRYIHENIIETIKIVEISLSNIVNMHITLELPFVVNLSSKLNLGYTKKWMNIDVVLATSSDLLDIKLVVGLLNQGDNVAEYLNVHQHEPLIISDLIFGLNNSIGILKYIMLPVYYSWLLDIMHSVNISHLVFAAIHAIGEANPAIKSFSLVQDNDFDIELGYLLDIPILMEKIQLNIGLNDVNAIHVELNIKDNKMQIATKFTSKIYNDMLEFNNVGINGLILNENNLLSKLDVKLDFRTAISRYGDEVKKWINKQLRQFVYTFGSTVLNITEAAYPLCMHSTGFMNVPINLQLMDIRVNLGINNVEFGVFNVGLLTIIQGQFDIRLVGDFINSKKQSEIINDIYMGILNNKELTEVIDIRGLIVGEMQQLNELMVNIPLQYIYPHNTQLKIPKLSDLKINGAKVNIISTNMIELQVGIEIRNPFPIKLYVNAATASVNINNSKFTSCNIYEIELDEGITRLDTRIECQFNENVDLSNIIQHLVYEDELTTSIKLNRIKFGNKNKLYSMVEDIEIGVQLGDVKSEINPYLEILEVNGEVNKRGIDVSAVIKIEPEITGNIYGLSVEIEHVGLKNTLMSLNVDNMDLKAGTLDALIKLENIQAMKDIWDTSVERGNVLEQLRITNVVINGPIGKSLTFLDSTSVRLPEYYATEVIGYFTLKNLVKMSVNVFVPILLPFDVRINFHNFYFEAWDYIDENRTRLDYLVATVDEQFEFKSSDKGAKLSAEFTGSFLKLGNIIKRMNRVKGLKDLRVDHPVDGEIPWITELNKVGFFFKGEFRLKSPELQEISEIYKKATNITIDQN
eukprot:NODE_413_length_9103_cov_0.450911.p1 type:complete len:2339 gc:universal NODE_413_length_9103_cov_0.450911:8645-1629(-)